MPKQVGLVWGEKLDISRKHRAKDSIGAIELQTIFQF